MWVLIVLVLIYLAAVIWIEREWKKSFPVFLVGMVSIILSDQLNKPEYRKLTKEFGELRRAYVEKEGRERYLGVLLERVYGEIRRVDRAKADESMRELLKDLPDRLEAVEELSATVQGLEEKWSLATLPLVSWILDQFDTRIAVLEQAGRIASSNKADPDVFRGEASTPNFEIVRVARLKSGNYITIEMQPGVFDQGQLLNVPEIRIEEHVNNTRLHVISVQFLDDGVRLRVNNARFSELRNVEKTDAMSKEVRDTIQEGLNVAIADLLVHERG